MRDMDRNLYFYAFRKTVFCKILTIPITQQEHRRAYYRASQPLNQLFTCGGNPVHLNENRWGNTTWI